MSIARHHAEWLSLLEISGPFLSMPVLLNAFPQGLQAHDPEHVRELRAAYEEWADNQGGLQPDPAIHHAWIRYVLRNTLELPDEVLAEGQAIPESIKTTLPEYGEVLRPSLMVKNLNDNPLLLIQVLPATQSLDKPIPKQPWKASPATRMMTLLHATEIRLGLVTNGEQWMLVDAPRGETTGFTSWYASLWLEESLTLRAFRSLLGADRFFNVPDEQTLTALLAASAKDQHEVTDQLGYQVRQAVEILIQAIDKADQDRGRALLTDMPPERLYEASLTVMMRLVFLLTAEERGLLLLGDPIYDQHYAISTLRAQLREMADQQGEEVLERRFDAWSRLLATFRAVFGGIEHENLKLPAYGGSLFDPDRFPFLEGRPANTQWYTSQAQPLPINNRTVLHLLEALQVLQVKIPGGGGGEARRLSFRALDIEQIGHVYEGLLDHVAIRAAEPVLGLQGTRDKEPEIPISELETQQAKGQTALIEYLREQTGRTSSALENGLNGEIDAPYAGRLRRACGNDESLYQRVLPFAGLVRGDDYGVPVVISGGSIYVTAGPTRRATGTHYTPRSLTEPIVQHTLEPLVYIGPTEGWPREKWQLRSPAELLNLKICDMAMGSGAFLVQACRYLSERLVEAWEVAQTNLQPSRPPGNDSPHLQITPEGKPATGDPGETLIPQDEEERLTFSRRLVVDRCLYGVDKNHLAVEMAKLSLWLVTLDKNRSFTFLNHALKHGDSIIGADEEMFLDWVHRSSMPLFETILQKELTKAREKRQALQSFEVRDVRDAERKAQLLAEAEAAIERIQLGCNLLVGVRLLDDLSQSEQDTLLANALIEYTNEEAFSDPDAERAIEAAKRIPAFHWPFEFPEVFADEGFSAFLGNPPFQSGKGRENSIAATFGDRYVSLLEHLYVKNKRSADLCAYFFFRARTFLRPQGSYGLIATNSISEGTTREVALEPLFEIGGKIYRANDSVSWPGSAAVLISTVHAIKGAWKGVHYLNNDEEKWISARLEPTKDLGKPHVLANTLTAFHGTKPRGDFTVRIDELPISKYGTANLPLFLSGQDVNGSPKSLASRRILYFPYETEAEASKANPELFEILRKKVYEYRQSTGIPKLMKKWWRYEHEAQDLYDAIQQMKMEEVFASCRVSNTFALTPVPADQIFADGTVIFLLPSYACFAVLQSTIYQVWVRKYCSTFKQDIRFNIKDVVTNFCLPDLETQKEFSKSLSEIGERYLAHRSSITIAKQSGLSTCYNQLFHNPEITDADIAHLRQLHMDMDNAVTAAYGWDDQDLGHGFHETPQGIRYTISETARREVLSRLLKLNHERYAEEVRLGLHEKKTKGKRKTHKKTQPKKKKNDGQMSLF